MSVLQHTFKKEERLCSKKMIESLFRQGHSFVEKPFRVVWRKVEHEMASPVQIAISIPKKRVRKAAARNRLKRQTREAYRQHKHAYYDFVEQAGGKTIMMLIYTGSETANYWEIEEKIILILQRLVNEYEKSA